MIINIQDDILRIQALGLLDKLLIVKTTKRNIMWARRRSKSLRWINLEVTIFGRKEGVGNTYYE